MNRDKAATIIQRQARRYIQRQRHLDDITPSRRTNEPISGSHEYLTKGRGIPFPVGYKSNGELIWRTENADFLAAWFASTRMPTNPWTREGLGSTTLPHYIYNAVMKKAERRSNVDLQTLLNHADILDDPVLMRRYLNAGGDPNAMLGSRPPLLMHQIMRLVTFPTMHDAIVQSVRVLAEGGANTNVTGLFGWTPLHIMTRFRNTKHRVMFNGNVVSTRHWMDVTETLLRHGANPNALSDDGETPLDHLMTCHQIEESDIEFRLQMIRVVREYGGRMTRTFDASACDISRATKELLRRALDE